MSIQHSYVVAALTVGLPIIALLVSTALVRHVYARHQERLALRADAEKLLLELRAATPDGKLLAALIAETAADTLHWSFVRDESIWSYTATWGAGYVHIYPYTSMHLRSDEGQQTIINPTKDEYHALLYVLDRQRVAREQAEAAERERKRLANVAAALAA